MSRFTIFLFAFLMPLCAQAIDSTTVIGKWRYFDGKLLSSDMIFHKGNAFETRVTINGKFLGTASGVWHIEGKTIRYRYTASALSQIPANATDQDTIESLTSKQLVLLTRSGATHTYARIEP